MPRRPQPKDNDLTLGQAFETISSQLAVGVKRPNVHNYKPHEKQLQFHSSTARTRLYIGGNRSGKTVGGIVEDIFRVTGRHPYQEVKPPPVNGRIISVDFVNGVAGIIFPVIKQWLPPSDLIRGSWEESYDATERILTLENGSTIDFKTYDQELEKHAGTSRDFVHFDEEPPKDIYTENLLRTVDVDGVNYITMTPVEGMTWVYSDIYESGILGQRNSTEVIIVDISENVYLKPEVIEAVIGLLDDDEKEARAHGKFVQMGGAIYPHFDPKPGGMHVIDIDDPMLIVPRDKNALWVCSLDHGFNNPTAWLWHFISPDGAVITFFEHYKSGLVVKEHADIVHEINSSFGREPDLYIGDPSIRNTDPISGTSVHQEYMANGIPIVLGNNDVHAGIIRVAGYLRDRGDGKANWHITKNCNKLIWEMSKYRWKIYANKKLQRDNNAREEPHKKDDHAVDSARYFFMNQPDLASGYLAKMEKKKPSPNDQFGAPEYTSDNELYSRVQQPVPFKSREYAFGDAQTEWVIDEFMGGEY